jgi:prefoldin beta subunit
MLREQIEKLREEINSELAKLRGGSPEAAKGGG